MAKFNVPNRSVGLLVVSTVLSLIAIILTVITFIAGVKPGVLPDLALFKVDTSDLEIPSALASSQFLKDLEKVSGGDLTGSGKTANALGLADTYSIHILTVCSKNDGKTKCSDPEVGWWFNPKKTLKLNGTGFKYSKSFNTALDHYENAAYFMGIGYILAVVFGALAPIMSSFSGKIRGFATASAVLSWLATILLIADAAVTIMKTHAVVGALDKDLGKLGIDAKQGSLVYLPFAAFAVSLIASILYAYIAYRAKGDNGNHSSSRARAVGGKADLSDIDREVKNANAAGGIFKRAVTWSKHRYVQVERQPEIKVTNTPGYEQAVMMDPSDEIQDTNNNLDYRNPAAERDIAMVPLSSNGNRLDLVYEPYTSQTARARSRSPAAHSAHSDHDENLRYEDREH